MKFNLSILCLLAMFAPVLLQAKAPVGHQIEVKIKGFEETTLYMAYHLGNKQYLSDTVEVKNGKAVFTGPEVREKGIYMVVLPPDNNYFEFIMGEDQEFRLETEGPDFVANMKVSGSEENTVFYQNLRQINVHGKKANEIQTKLKDMDKASDEHKAAKKELQDLYDTMNDSRRALVKEHPDLLYAKIINAMQDPEVPDAPEGADENFSYYYYRDHYFDKVDFSEAGLLRTPILEGKILQYVDKLTIQHYDSLKVATKYLIDKSRADREIFKFVAVTLLNKYAKSQIMCHDAVYVSIVDQVYKTGDAWWADEEQIQKIIKRADALRFTMCGNVAPQMMMKDTEGKVRSMHDLKSEYTLLYFWDYDCGHCKKVTPKLAELYPRYKDKSVNLYAVSINGDLGKWKEKLKEYGMDDINVINVQDHARKTGFDYFYDLRSTPRIFVLDKDKKILAKQISTDQLKDMLDKFLDMPEDLDKATEETREGEE